MNLETTGKLADHCPAERLLSCQDFGDARFRDPCLAAQSRVALDVRAMIVLCKGSLRSWDRSPRFLHFSD